MDYGLMKYYLFFSNLHITFCGGTIALFQHAVKIHLNSWLCLPDSLLIDGFIFVAYEPVDM